MSEKKIAIVTGANNGVGFETTAGMAKAGYSVVMACRNQSKAKAARLSLIRRLPEADLEIMVLDLSSMDSIKHFANAFKAKHDHLNVLINNAGVLSYQNQKTKDGFEIQLGTNHLGHFLLTALLLQLMPDQSESRIVSLSSIAHKPASIDFNDINRKNNPGNIAYGQSKLACLMFGSELNRRLQKSGKKIISVSAHPGGTDSGLFDDMSRLQYFTLKALSPLITHSNASAAKPSLMAALDKNINGDDYLGPQGFMDLKGPPGKAKRSDYSKQQSPARRLWEISEQLTNTPFTI